VPAPVVLAGTRSEQPRAVGTGFRHPLHESASSPAPLFRNRFPGEHRDRRGPEPPIPAARPAMTRLLREHPAIDVELDAAGRLVAIRWNGQREPVEVCNAWRVAESWWREPIERDYCKVVGRRWLALVYLDRVSGTWHLERLYD
jgi:hypothetical protein